MTEKEKQAIIAEIERRISADDARGRTLREVASFISSIPTEDYPMPEDTVIFQKGVAEGRRLEREDAEWSEEDEAEFNNILTFIKNDIPISNDTRREFYAWLKSLHPQKQEEPAEFDLEKEIERFLGSEESTSYTNAGGYKVSFKDSIKIAKHFYELGRKSHWKPSEEQMEALKECGGCKNEIKSLYEQLKKL